MCYNSYFTWPYKNSNVSADLEGKWRWSFPWILKSNWTNIGLNNTAFRKTRILLPSSSEYKYIRYWGEGGHIRPLCYPPKRKRIVGLKKRYSFEKFIKFWAHLRRISGELFWSYFVRRLPLCLSVQYSHFWLLSNQF